MSLLASSFINNPKHIEFEGEDEDEDIILLLRRHFITNVRWIVITIAFAVLGVFVGRGISQNFPGGLPQAYSFIIYAFWYIFVFGYALESYLSWFFHVNIVTTKRVVDIDFSGLVHRRYSEAFLSSVEDLTHQVSGVAQVVFHYGSLHIQTAAELRELDFECVPNPSKVQDIISDLVAEERRKRYVNG